MDKYRLNLRNIANNNDNKTTVLVTLPVGPRYHYVGLALAYSSGTNTIAGAILHLTELRVKVNGRIQRQYSGQQLRDLNLLNGTAYDMTGVPNTSPGVTIPIFFAEPWREDPVDQDALAWATSGWNSFQIEIDLPNAISSSSSRVITGFAVVDNFVPPAGSTPGIVKQLRYTAAAAGTSYDVNLDRMDWLQQISVYPDSGATNQPSKVTLRRNGEIIHELPAVANTALLTNWLMTPAASGRTTLMYDAVLDHDGLLSSAILLDGARDASLTIEAAATMSGTTTYMVARLGPPQ